LVKGAKRIYEFILSNSHRPCQTKEIDIFGVSPTHSNSWQQGSENERGKYHMSTGRYGHVIDLSKLM
jgi:glutamine cyclotransferase